MAGPGESIQEILKSRTNGSWDKIEARLLEELPLVTKVNLRRTRDTGYSLGEIEALGRTLQRRAFPRIESLRLEDYHEVCDSVIGELVIAIRAGNLSNLEVLKLSWTGISDTSAQMLAKAMDSGNLSRLQDLDLSFTSIGDDGLAALASALGSGRVPSLKVLQFGSHRCTDLKTCYPRGSVALAKTFLSGNVSLLEDLTLYGMFEEDVITIMKALGSGVAGPFESLKLLFCNIGLEGVRIIAEALVLPIFSSLVTLDLSHNKFLGDTEVLVLSKAFRSTNLNNLSDLGLKSTSIGEKGWMEIASLLESGHLPGFKILRLLKDKLSQQSAQEWVKAYRNNIFLVGKVDDAIWPSPSLRNNAEGFWSRNMRLAESMELLKNDPLVDGPHGKVFLCGQPNVGKTTLRKSLCRTRWESLTTSERRFKKVVGSSRGIEVSQISYQKDLSLSVWDINVGQPAYHLLHCDSGFLPDMAFSGGPSTIFVIVCSVNYSGKNDVGLAKQELEYWMRHISSSSVKGIRDFKRNVVVVLNSFHGDHSCHDLGLWTTILSMCSLQFEEFLNIFPYPFILNAKYRKEVSRLKKKVLETSASLLRQHQIPKSCRQILDIASEWLSSNSHYPLLRWKTYARLIDGDTEESVPRNARKLRAATELLHEHGQLILFREGAPGLQLQDELGLAADESIVILDPGWFCMTIAENILRPHSGIKSGEASVRLSLYSPSPSLSPSNGSSNSNSNSSSTATRTSPIPASTLKAHIAEDDLGVGDVSAVLLSLGLAYEIGRDFIFIPALIVPTSLQLPHYWGSGKGNRAHSEKDQKTRSEAKQDQKTDLGKAKRKQENNWRKGEQKRDQKTDFEKEKEKEEQKTDSSHGAKAQKETTHLSNGGESRKEKTDSENGGEKQKEKEGNHLEMGEEKPKQKNDLKEGDKGEEKERTDLGKGEEMQKEKDLGKEEEEEEEKKEEKTDSGKGEGEEKEKEKRDLGRQWVMGFSLELEDPNCGLLAPSVFRQLQMDLVRDPEFGARSDSHYVAGDNFITFKNQGMAVMVEFDPDPVNRLYFLVKPLAADQGRHMELQVNLADTILTMAETICNKRCPGLQLSKNVVHPWVNSQEEKEEKEEEEEEEPNPSRRASSRMGWSMEEVKEWVKRGSNNPWNGNPSSKIVLAGEPIRGDQLLSTRDLHELRLSIDNQCNLIKESVVELQLSPNLDLLLQHHQERQKEEQQNDEQKQKDREKEELAPSTAKSILQVSLSRRELRPSASLFQRSRSIISRILQRSDLGSKEQQMRMDDMMTAVLEVRQALRSSFDQLKSLLHHVQSLEKPPFSQSDPPTPRFVYLAHRDNPSSWLRLAQALEMPKEHTRLHFLCELSFEDATLHEVRQQDGVELTQLRDCVHKLAPLVEWTLKVAFVASKIAGSGVLPGLASLLLPGIPQTTITTVGELVRGEMELMHCVACTMEGGDGGMEADAALGLGVCGSAARSGRSMAGHFDAARRSRAEGRAALKILLGRLSPKGFFSKTGLRRVLMEPHKSSSSSPEALWVCADCFDKYRKAGASITEI